MFAGPNAHLRPARAIELFSQCGFQLDDIVRPAEVIDDEGHLEYSRELQLTGDKHRKLQALLEDNEQFQVEYRNRDLFFSISFATRYRNPYIMIGCSRKIFGALAKTDQNRYLQMLKQLARACCVPYIVIVDDPPDYFEDRFIDVDGLRFLDDMIPSGKQYEVCGVWVDKSAGGLRPEGVSQLLETDIGDGFTKWTIGNRPRI